MDVRPILMRILNLVIIRVIHPVIELILRQALVFSLLNLSPMLMPCYMPQVVLSLYRLMRIGIQKLPLVVFLGPPLDFFPDVSADIWSM